MLKKKKKKYTINLQSNLVFTKHDAVLLRAEEMPRKWLASGKCITQNSELPPTGHGPIV
jgi:hypothetical protein